MTINIKKIKVASRKSALALKQVDILNQLLTEAGVNIHSELETYATMGDKDKAVSLTANSADNFFTDSLDEAVLNKQADIAMCTAPRTYPRNLTMV